MCVSASPCGISGGMDRMAVCVPVMVEPSGRLIVMPYVMGVPFLRLAWACK
jgi:hypothetical protein